MKLEVEKELERKLSAGQILNEDMEQVIEHCEREDRGIIDPETGHRIGHLKIQHMTYWAEYEVLPDGGYKLWNGYSHRMNLESDEYADDRWRRKRSADQRGVGEKSHLPPVSGGDGAEIHIF